jgi:hypothetical protein
MVSICDQRLQARDSSLISNLRRFNSTIRRLSIDGGRGLPLLNYRARFSSRALWQIRAEHTRDP